MKRWATAAAASIAAVGLCVDRVAAERVAEADFSPGRSPTAWSFAVSHPDGVAIAAQASGPRLEDENWVLRLGASTSVTKFAPVPLDAVEHPVVSWVMRVERARWEDDAFFEVRARDGRGEERMLARWDADDLRAAKPGHGNFQTVPLPPGVAAAEIVVEARAAAARGSAWIDFFKLRVDGTNRAQDPPRPAEWERPPYLQLVGRDRATLRWRSRYPTASLLRWWSDGGERGSAREWRSPGRRTEHRALLDGLTPATTYHYEIELGGKMMAQGPLYRFRTAPDSKSEAKIGVWVIGDSGKCGAHDHGCQQSARVRDAFESVAAGDAPELWLLLGDNAYPYGSDWAYSKALFRHYARVAAATPLWPVLGNHDLFSANSAEQSGAYFEAFDLPAAAELGGVPSGTEAYYSFDWGPIHFVALDSAESDRGADGSMAAWLDADLEASGDATWRIALLHHPPYSRGSHDSDDPEDGGGRMIEVREVFVPILERHGVDLVLSGHSHGYERSRLLHGHYGGSMEYRAHEHDYGLGRGTGRADDPYRKPVGRGEPGTVYVVVGSSSEASNRMHRHPVMEQSLARPGSLWLQIAGRSLRARFIDDAGAVLDEFSIRKDPARPLEPAGDAPNRVWIWGACALAALSIVALWWARPER